MLGFLASGTRLLSGKKRVITCDDKRTVKEYLSDLRNAMDGTPLDISRSAIIGYYQSLLERGVIRESDTACEALEKSQRYIEEKLRRRV